MSQAERRYRREWRKEEVVGKGLYGQNLYRDPFTFDMASDWQRFKEKEQHGFSITTEDEEQKSDNEPLGKTKAEKRGVDNNSNQRQRQKTTKIPVTKTHYQKP